MQSLEIISVNLWQILISLCNLVLLFLLLRKFLYAPVQKVLAQRRSEIDAQYANAQQAENTAERKKAEWEQKMETAQRDADTIVRTAVERADARSAEILSETREKADRMIRKAEDDAAMERKKAEADIKKEIVDVSAALSEKLLGREIKESDHRALIDDFIAGIGTEHDG